MRRIIIRITFILTAILILETIFIAAWFWQEKSAISVSYEKERKIIKANKEIEKDKLFDDFNNKKYLATGKNVYQRIYNRPNQDILSLISNLANEALPGSWSNEIRVEEFTNFILLIQIDKGAEKPSANHIAKHLKPIVEYSYPYLNNVAVFDENYECYLYFDEDILNRLRAIEALGSKDGYDAEQKGREFTKFNSIKIDFQAIEGHIFLPVIIGNVETSVMMLDTGASTTVISKDVASKTAFKKEDLTNAEIRTFSTAKGKMECPIIRRNVSLGAIDRDMAVAVNFSDEMNLLGVDFFEGYHYSIDSKDNCIYIWKR